VKPAAERTANDKTWQMAARQEQYSSADTEGSEAAGSIGQFAVARHIIAC
jgi:hypothetical protein